MGFLDALFGSAPSVDTQTLDTKTPQQQASLDQLLKQLSGGGAGRDFAGDVNVGLSDLQQLSLSGLEDRATTLSDPNRNAELFRASSETLLKFLDFESQNANVEDFFNTNIRDPALKSFSETVLPGIGRDFGGANFFSSERGRADSEAREDLIGSLTRSRSDITFQADQANRNRAIQALGLTGQVDAAGRAASTELSGLLDAGGVETGLNERNVSREFQQFLAEAGLDDTQIEQLLAGINTQTFENIVTVNPGSSGIVGGLLSAAGAAGGFGSLFGAAKAATSSDRRLKDNIIKIGKIAGHNLYTWTWNVIAQSLGIQTPTIGVIAQEVEHIPGVVMYRDGYRIVDYNRLLGVI